MLTAGVDIGAASAKIVILRDGQVLVRIIQPTGHDVVQTADRVVEEALKQAGLSLGDLDHVIATGYGRDSVSVAREAISEIICHARGASWLIPGARTVIDIGGQDSKAIRVDDRGNVTDFVMNDRCAAGTGRFLEVMARALNLEMEELGEISSMSEAPCAISSVCTVFAETEVVSLRAQRRTRQDIVAGIHRAIARRVSSMMAQMGHEEPVVFTGGVARNAGVRRALEQELGTVIVVPPEPQITGALGAALLATVKVVAR